MSDEQEAFRKNLYLSSRTQITSLLNQSCEDFDKAILTLSSGALGLSIAFLKDIVKPEHAEHLSFLILSWGFFIASLLSTLLSFLIAQSSLSLETKNLDSIYQTGEPLKEKNRWASFTKFLNGFSAFSFIVAVSLTITFVSINLTSIGDSMAKQVKGDNLNKTFSGRTDLGEGRGFVLPPRPLIQPQPKPSQSQQQGSGKKSGK